MSDIKTFFGKMHAICQDGVSLKVVFQSMPDGQLGVIAEPTLLTENPDFNRTLSPVGAVGSVEDWDEAFFDKLTAPIQEAAKKMWNANSMLAEAEMIEKQAKAKLDAAKKTGTATTTTEKIAAKVAEKKEEPKPEPKKPDATDEQVAKWIADLQPGHVTPVVPKKLDTVRKEADGHTLTAEQKERFSAAEKAAEEAYKKHKATAHPKGKMTLEVIKVVENAMKGGTTLDYVKPNLALYEYDDLVIATALEEVLDKYKDNAGLF
jgi:hypothetical protein